MKKLFLQLAAAVMLCGCSTLSAAPENEYRVLVLGDLHYDGMEYHKTPAVTPNRAKERLRAPARGLYEK